MLAQTRDINEEVENGMAWHTHGQTRLKIAAFRTVAALMMMMASHLNRLSKSQKMTSTALMTCNIR
jgi:hypothetical protein